MSINKNKKFYDYNAFYGVRVRNVRIGSIPVILNQEAPIGEEGRMKNNGPDPVTLEFGPNQCHFSVENFFP